MKPTNRNPAYWIIIGYLSIALILLLLGQTTAIINYDFAVDLGLQENINEVGPFGIQVNRAFAAADTLVYIPLITASIIGLILRKRWSLLTTAAVMGISIYWATTITLMLTFLENTPGYHLQPGLEYVFFLATFILFGTWALLYLIFRGKTLIT
ncbi:MAG: hypothetical protein OQK76_00990 [Gammaproteobacteria bacterium]|nr:hypothetical protein [Gammaproteobacteria bacterium]MCW9005695.1 hypothetical protein [Gammaproteobacteria bacterium]MCW9055268.1 hypothetical protein [Gammaproteobacteria bacterium]